MIIPAIILLVAYLAYACVKTHGIPECLSDTAYTVGKSAFALTMAAVCGLLWCPMLETTAEEWQFLVFLAMAGMMAMAVSPYKDDKINHIIHYTGTMLAMVCVLCLWLTRGWVRIPVVVVACGLALPWVTKRWLLMLELIMFTLTFIYSFS